MKKSLIQYVKTLTIEQLVRFYENVLTRIWNKFEGGMMFGVDWSTLRYVAPGLGDALSIIQNERRQRLRFDGITCW